jgi:hypothetical protein
MKANEPARRPGLPSYLNGVIAGDYASYDFNANASAKQLRASGFVQRPFWTNLWGGVGEGIR